MVNQKVLEASKKQNLEELLSALKPHLTRGPKENSALIVYFMDSDGRPASPAHGWLSGIEDGHINVGESDTCYHSVPFNMNEKGYGFMVVRVDTRAPEDVIYCHQEGWKFYETAAEEQAQRDAKETLEHSRRKYLPKA
jgi:hypothetical protein